jgi:predicted DNA-binding transcriptional regulator AlpA
MNSATLDISQVAERLKCSERTVRNKIKQRLIPKPMKRNSDHESLRWRTSDIDSFLGIKNQPAANDPFAHSIDAIIDARVEAKVREVLEEKLPQLEQIISQL